MESEYLFQIGFNNESQPSAARVLKRVGILRVVLHDLKRQ